MVTLLKQEKRKDLIMSHHFLTNENWNLICGNAKGGKMDGEKSMIDIKL